jgi:tetratricopeptide (TPR) repeat protein
LSMIDWFNGRLHDILVAQLTWGQLFAALTIVVGVIWGWVQLWVSTRIKEKVKHDFSEELESLKANLDREKQQALKTFGLFSEKKYELNAQVYTALRTAYHSVNTSILGLHRPTSTKFFSSTELDDYLASIGADLQTRKPLIKLHEIDPDIASAHISRLVPSFEREKLSTDLAGALDLTYTNELFLARPVVGLCDDIIELLRTATSIPMSPLLGDRARAALDQVPVVLARLVSEMRKDLLGTANDEDTGIVIRKSSPIPPMFHGLPESVPISDIANSNALRQQLTSHRIPLDQFRKSVRAEQQSLRSRLDAVHSALERNPDDQEARLTRARLLLSLGNLDAAERDINILLEKGSKNPDVTFALSDCLLRRNRHLDALAKINEYIEQRSDDVKGYLHRGTIFRFINRNAAEEDLRKALELDPKNVWARARLGELMWLERKANEAEAAIAHALSLRPDNPLAQLIRLELLADSHTWQPIPELSEELLAVLPNNPRVITLVGRAFNVLERFAEAESFANQFADDEKLERKGAVRCAALAVRAAARCGLKEYELSVMDADAAIAGAPSPSPVFGDSYGDAHIAKMQALEALENWYATIVAAKAAYWALKPNTYESARVLEALQRVVEKTQDGGVSVAGPLPVTPPPCTEAAKP